MVNEKRAQHTLRRAASSLRQKCRHLFLSKLLLLVALTTAEGVRAASLAYITNLGSDNVTVIDAETSEVVATFGTGKSPFGVAVNPNGRWVYVGNTGSNSVSVVRTSNNSTLTSYGSSPTGIAAHPDGSRVYVANSATDEVTVFSTSTNLPVASVAVGSDPVGIAVAPDGSRVYVANFAGNSVSVIDAVTNTVVSTIPVANNPRGVAVAPLCNAHIRLSSNRGQTRSH